jgi:hypothetical protein
LQAPPAGAIRLAGGPIREAIVPDDKSNSEAAAQGSGRKSKPPVIELTATDRTPEEPMKAESRKSEETREAPRTNPNAQASSQHKPSFLIPALAGLGGLLVGALALALVVLFAGDRVSRVIASAAEMVSGPKAAAELSALAKHQEELRGEIAGLSAKLKDVDVSAIKSRLDGLDAGIKSLQDGANDSAKAREALNDRITALETRVKEAAARPAVASAAEVVALGALSDAIAKGGSFSKELDAARAMLGDAGSVLKPLDASAEKGLPTNAELRRRFSELAPKLAREPQASDGFFGKLLSRLVEIRPVGEVAGTSAGAVVARIETRLARGDLAAALDEAAQLPPQAKAEAADWIAVASRRREADTIVKNLMSAAMPAAEPSR